jgi:predicted nucleic acid-binding protein
MYINGVQNHEELVLCDTNIFIEIYKRNDVIRDILFKKIGLENVVISDVTRAELFYGAINKMELQTIRKDLCNFMVLHIDSFISKMAVEFVDKYCLSHKTSLEDALIAATAIVYNIKLYTLNIKDFIFIPGVNLFQPSK